MRRFLLVGPAFVLGGLVIASLTGVARANASEAHKGYDYEVTCDAGTVTRLGAMGYSIVAITPSHTSDLVTWTMERK